MGDSKSESATELESSGSPVFSPPLDYKRVKHLKKFHKKNGEKLWLIKLPRDLDISKLKSLPLEINDQEQPISVEKGDDDKNEFRYSIFEDKTQTGGRDSSNLSLLIPRESRESLKVSGHGDSLKFDKIFNVRRSVEIPKIDYEKVIVPRSNVVRIEGLQTRHYASGYGPEEEVHDTKASKEEHSEHKSKKRKKHSSDEKGHSGKKSKKDKKK